MPRSPLVALSATSALFDGYPRVRLNAAYIHATELAGGVPVIVPPLERLDDAARVLDSVDALVLTGGEDIHPARFGEQPHPALGEVNLARDATELALVQGAQARSLPTLAICRGIQLLNVAFGGSLVQDIPSQRPGSLPHDPPAARDACTHDLTLDESSRLARILGGGSSCVNSRHHQAPDRVGHGLRVTAWAPDDVIEGLEWNDEDWWAVGVQWHPEDLMKNASASGVTLFSALIAQARSGRSGQVLAR